MLLWFMISYVVICYIPLLTPVRSTGQQNNLIACVRKPVEYISWPEAKPKRTTDQFTFIHNVLACSSQGSRDVEDA